MFEKQKKTINFATMITIDKHISRLIALHDCVIVPGLGAFLAQRIPAYYNTEEQIFMPPHRTLCFNPHITMDDALLTTAYMQHYGISYNQATAQLKEDVKKLKNNLSRNGEHYLGELGKMSMDIEGNITFTPSENGIDDPANYGFAPLPIATLEQKSERTITIPISRKRIAQYIAAAAAIVIMFVFVTPLSEHTFKDNTKASFGDFASPEQISMMQQISSPRPAANTDESCKIVPVESVRQTAIKEQAPDVEVVAEPATEASESATSVAEIIPADTKQNHIIGARSPNAENAQLAITELSRKAEFKYSVVECGKRHRISAGSYTTNEEALAQLPAIQANFPDAWIYIH